MRLLILSAVTAVAIAGCATADMERAFGERKSMGTFATASGDTISTEGTRKWGRGGHGECEIHMTYNNISAFEKRPTVRLLVLNAQSGNTFAERTVYFPTILPGKSAYKSESFSGNWVTCDAFKLKVSTN